MPSIVDFFETSERSASVSIDGERTYDRTFKVVTDSPSTDPLWIFAALAANNYVYLYKYYQTSTESDLQALISSMTLRQDPNDGYGYCWDLTIPYAPVDPYAHSINPLLVYPRVTFEGTNEQVIAYTGYDGTPITNSAYDSFDPPPMKFSAGCVMRVHQNLSTFSPSTIFFYTNLINSDVFFGMPVHTCKIDPPRGSIAFAQTCGQYWETEWQIVCKPNPVFDPGSGNIVFAGWDEYIVSRGYRQLVSGSPVRIYDVHGEPLTEPALLDGSGGYLTPPVAPSSVHIMQYQIYQDASFASIFGFTTAGQGALFF